MLRVICSFSIDKGGHYFIQYIQGEIETHSIDKGGKVQFALTFYVYITHNNISLLLLLLSSLLVFWQEINLKKICVIIFSIVIVIYVGRFLEKEKRRLINVNNFFFFFYNDISLVISHISALFVSLACVQENPFETIVFKV